nr:MAG TPA: hypothetical protein [Caudoviricetes sp.]
MPKQPALPNEQKLIHSSVKHSNTIAPEGYVLRGYRILSYSTLISSYLILSHLILH